MKIICAWCSTTVVDDKTTQNVSHSICDDCVERLRNEPANNAPPLSFTRVDKVVFWIVLLTLGIWAASIVAGR